MLRGGRVAIQDLRNLKTNAAGRVVPIHPLLIELGLPSMRLHFRKRFDDPLRTWG
jgi:hypothetical protein